MNSAVHQEEKTVTAIVVTYHSENEIEDIINNLENEAVISKIIVVDNSTNTNTINVINAMQPKKVEILRYQTNIGLAAANNIGISKVKSEFTLICNPDLHFKHGTVSKLAEELSYLEASVVGPVNRDEDGTPHSSFHRNWTVFHIFIWRCLPSNYLRKFYSLFRTYKTQKVKYVSGSFLLTRTEYLNSVGGYDEAFFLSLEDACDLCERISEYTKKPVYLTDRCSVTHHVSKSAIQVPVITQWMGAVGSFHYIRKTKPRLQAIVVRYILLCKLLQRWSFAKGKKKIIQKKMFLAFLKLSKKSTQEMIAEYENINN